MKKRLVLSVAVLLMGLVGCSSKEANVNPKKVYEYYRIMQDSYDAYDEISKTYTRTEYYYILTDESKMNYEKITIDGDNFTREVNFYINSSNKEIRMEVKDFKCYTYGHDCTINGMSNITIYKQNSNRGSEYNSTPYECKDIWISEDYITLFGEYTRTSSFYNQTYITVDYAKKNNYLINPTHDDIERLATENN